MDSNFLFYGSWGELLDSVDTEEEKREIAYQIVLCGLGRELTTTNKLLKGMINATVKPNIEASQRRYNAAVANGAKGGRPKAELPIDDIMQLHNDGYTYKEIADMYEVSTNTIGNRIREYKNQKPNPKTNKNLEKEKDIEIDIDNDTDNYVDSLLRDLPVTGDTVVDPITQQEVWRRMGF